jgi:hypothetical protein
MKVRRDPKRATTRGAAEMADTLDHPDKASADEIIEAVRDDTERRMAEATLPDPSVDMPEAEAGELLGSFRRTRDAHRGRYAAPVRELPADGVRVATAIAILSRTAGPEELRRQLEDLVDLQAFVPDPPDFLRPTPSPDPLLESIRWRQAALMAFAMNHASVIGDHNAIRDRWTAIGDARAAIDLVNKYRETQAGGFAAITAWLIGAPIGFGLAVITGNARPSIAAIVGLGIGWFAAPFLGAAVGLFESRVERSAFRRSHPTLAGRLELVVGFGAIALVPVVVGVAVTILAARLGLP